MTHNVSQPLSRVIGDGADPTEDPVMAATRRAPRMSPDDAAKCRALIAEHPTDINDPSQWMTEEEFASRIEARRRARGK